MGTAELGGLQYASELRHTGVESLPRARVRLEVSAVRGEIPEVDLAHARRDPLVNLPAEIPAPSRPVRI